MTWNEPNIFLLTNLFAAKRNDEKEGFETNISLFSTHEKQERIITIPKTTIMIIATNDYDCVVINKVSLVAHRNALATHALMYIH